MNTGVAKGLIIFSSLAKEAATPAAL